MKALTVLVLCAVLALACADSAHLKGKQKLMHSSKTFVSSDGMHRFCIPIGKASVDNVQSLSLHVPRREQGFSVRLDTSPSVTLASPISSEDKHCKRVSSLMLVKDFKQTQGFSYMNSEVRKSGTISGWIVGEKPEWISVRLNAFGNFQDFAEAEATCESVLGVKSEAADWEKNGKHGHNGGHGHHQSATTRALRAARITLIFAAIASTAVCFLYAIRALTRRCCCPASSVDAATQDVNNLELGVISPASAADEERDLALAIERSLEDEKHVVQVPQTAQPQFVFLPPQMMPAVVPAGAATPYVPMFAPQFMNYSFDEQRRH